MKQLSSALLLALILVLLLTGSGAFYVVRETEQVILTQFGKPVGEPISDAGLRFKIPFIQVVNRLEKRSIEWDGQPREMPTRDKTYIVVDAFARWRINDPTTFFLRLRDERSAHSRLDDIIGGEIRNVVASHELMEIVRSNNDRKPTQEDVSTDGLTRQVNWPPIKLGRSALEQQVFAAAVEKLKGFGLELLNVQFTRINYNSGVEQAIYQRMISERQQIAERFRSEGQGEAARILGNREKELRSIESEAYRKVQTIRGEADARAADIYARAYSQTPLAADFYSFLKSLETWQKVADPSTTLVLTTESEVFGLLKKIQPKQ